MLELRLDLHLGDLPLEDMKLAIEEGRTNHGLKVCQTSCLKPLSLMVERLRPLSSLTPGWTSYYWRQDISRFYFASMLSHVWDFSGHNGLAIATGLSLF